MTTYAKPITAAGFAITIDSPAGNRTKDEIRAVQGYEQETRFQRTKIEELLCFGGTVASNETRREA